MVERMCSNRNGNGTPDSGESPFIPLLDLCEGLVADGILNKMEASLLKNWLAADRVLPAGSLMARADVLVSRMISEGQLSDKERRELLEILDRDST